MIVTGLEETTKNKIKVYLDDVFAFVLYSQDLKQYHIALQRELSEAELSLIYRETVFRRAKQKAMQLLLRTDYSEYGMRRRLERDLYPQQAIDDTIAFLYYYHYLDDARYVEHYITSKGHSLGYAALKQRLQGQGISADMIQKIYGKLELSEDNVLQEQMDKRLAGKTFLTEKEQNRIVGYFLRRGFSYYKITECMRACLTMNPEVNTIY